MKHLKSAIFAISQAAIIGSPNGLTRNATINPLIPVVNDEKHIIIKAMNPSNILMIVKIPAEQLRTNVQNAINTLSTNIIGHVIIRRTNLIIFPPSLAMIILSLIYIKTQACKFYFIISYEKFYAEKKIG